ncbi:unnamed protein product [Cochlearia groenlandica]
MIVTAANTARMHKKNCLQFAQHLKLIGNLLEQLKISDMHIYILGFRSHSKMLLEDRTEGLEVIGNDKREYTLDEEDRKVQDVILKQESTREVVASVLKKTLSRSYPEMGFSEALKTENGKLQAELHRSRAQYDRDQCEVIQHLIDVTQTVADVEKDHKCKKNNDLCGMDSPKKINIMEASRSNSFVSSEHDLVQARSSQQHEEWHADLLD